MPGRQVVIAQRPAKVRAGPATGSCPADTGAEIDACIRAFAHAYPGERWDMTACLGHDAPIADRNAVYTMLADVSLPTEAA